MTQGNLAAYRRLLDPAAYKQYAAPTEEDNQIDSLKANTAIPPIFTILQLVVQVNGKELSIGSSIPQAVWTTVDPLPGEMEMTYTAKCVPSVSSGFLVACPTTTRVSYHPSPLRS